VDDRDLALPQQGVEGGSADSQKTSRCIDVYELWLHWGNLLGEVASALTPDANLITSNVGADATWCSIRPWRRIPPGSAR